MKDIEDNTNRQKYIPCSWIRIINFIKMTTIHKITYRFNAIPIELTMTFFIELEQIILKFVWKHKRPQIIKIILRKNGASGINLPDLRLYYRTTVIKQYGTSTKREIQINIGSPAIKPHTYGQLIYNKRGKNNAIEKRQSLQ